MKRYIRSSDISFAETGLSITPEELTSTRAEKHGNFFLLSAGIGSGYDGSGPAVTAKIEPVPNAANRYKVSYIVRYAPYVDWIQDPRIYLGLTTAEANAKARIREELDRLFPDWR